MTISAAMTTTASGAGRAAEPTTTTTPTMAVAAVMTQFTPKHRKPKAKRKRKGWGPYQSVTKERSVAFNLTLDIQTLRQEIQQLETTRDLLLSRSLQLRHSPTGSLMQTVHAFLRLFRQAFPVQQLGSRRVVDTSGERSDFLYSVIDPDTDFGGGHIGADFMIEQFRRYSLFTRFIAMDMSTFEIVLQDDGVVLITATGTWRFQVLRETILGMFPHVAANEWLLSRLVGQELCAPTTLLFRFTKNDLICQYQPDADYVVGFSQVLTDPDELADLLGQSRIGEHSAIGVAKDGRLEEVDEFVDPDQVVRRGDPLGGSYVRRMPRQHHDEPDPEYELTVTRDEDAVYHETRVSSSGVLPPQDDLLDFCVDVVLQYVAVFTRGWPTPSEAASTDAWETPQSQFLRRYVSPRVVYGHNCGLAAIEGKWKALSESFQVINVHVTASPEAWRDRGSVFVRVQLAYCLRIDGYSIRSVFPHTRQHPSLVSALVGATVECPSLLEFEWTDSDASVVSRVREQLYWDEALAPVLPRASDREFVLHHALLSPEGDVLQSSSQSSHPQPQGQTAYPSLRLRSDGHNAIV